MIYKFPSPSPEELYVLLVAFQMATPEERARVWEILARYREAANV